MGLLPRLDKFPAPPFELVRIPGTRRIPSTHSAQGTLAVAAGTLPVATGGITVTTAPDFLALPTVGVCGGTWLTPPDRVAARDWPAITALAEQAAALG